MFIVAEGISCTGKTTQLKMLVGRLNSKGMPAVFNHEPTSVNPYGKIVRRLIEKQSIESALLDAAEEIKLIPLVIKKLKSGRELSEMERQSIYMADRREDLVQTVIPNIAKGIRVLQDRYEMSTFAFAATQNVDREYLQRRQKRILGNVYMVPDVLLYFDLDPEMAVERLKASGKPIDIYETLPKIKKTKRAYERLLKSKDLYKTLYVIDARKPLDEVFRAICLKLNV